MSLVRLRRSMRRAHRRVREARMLIRSLRFRYQPVAAHLIPIRRCNLSCTYCNEYDDHSAPVPTADVLRRIDRLADLGTGVVTLSGGEPLLHPDLDAIIRHIRQRGAIATLITNGYLLTRDRIERLNRAGLDHLQISIDNVLPDDVSKKSLKVLDQKLHWLARARRVRRDGQLGRRRRHPESGRCADRRAARARARVFDDGRDHSRRSGTAACRSTSRSGRFSKPSWRSGSRCSTSRTTTGFRRTSRTDSRNDWQCRAGARYLYVCEDGLVHWCSQQRGHPGIPLEQYSAQPSADGVSPRQELCAAVHGGLRPPRRAGGRAA